MISQSIFSCTKAVDRDRSVNVGIVMDKHFKLNLSTLHDADNLTV